MLTFHGPNIITEDFAELPRAKSSSEKPILSKGFPKDDEKTEQKAQQKQKRLEERMGPGGKGYIHKSVVKSSNPNCGGSPAPLPQSFEYHQLIEEPSQFFPGQQQFFYRFIVLLDNHRLCDHLAVSIFAEIRRLSPPHIFSNEIGEVSSIGSVGASQQESYVHKIVKLKILGKFLGLLHFWPQWTTLLDRSKMG